MFAVFHVPEFSLQAVGRQQAKAWEDHTPRAIMAGDGAQARVTERNATARAAAVRLEMTAAQAVARCPRIALHPASPTAEDSAHATIIAVARNLTPHVELSAPGCVTADLRGCPRRDWASLGREAQYYLRTTGLAVRLGFAPYPLWAAAAARTTTVQAPVQVISLAEQATFLTRVPLRALAWPAELTDVLRLWGLRDAAAFAALPRGEVASRLGPEAAHCWDLLQGRTVPPLQVVPLVRRFTAKVELEYMLDTLEPLLFLLQRHLAGLTAELAAAAKVAAEVRLSLSLSDAPPLSLRLSLPEPTNDPALLTRILHTRLENVTTEHALTGFSLTLEPTDPRQRQRGLFETSLRNPWQFAETLDRLAALVGETRVGSPRMRDTWEPDAIERVSLPEHLPPPQPRIGPPLAGLPLQRWRPARPVQVWQSNGKPSFVRGENLQGAIAEANGPWRLAGAWWEDDRRWAQAEWDILLADGSAHRLAQTHDGWQWEGTYS